MLKRCQFCGRYYRPDPRAARWQKACRREICRKARKLLAQHRWTERNPGYFRGRYPYVRKWREAQKNTPRLMMSIIASSFLALGVVRFLGVSPIIHILCLLIASSCGRQISCAGATSDSPSYSSRSNCRLSAFSAELDSNTEPPCIGGSYAYIQQNVSYAISFIHPHK